MSQRPNVRFILISEKCLCYQTSLVISFLYYEQAFTSATTRSLKKVLSLHGIPNINFKVISAKLIKDMSKNKIAKVKQGHWASG